MTEEKKRKRNRKTKSSVPENAVCASESDEQRTPDEDADWNPHMMDELPLLPWEEAKSDDFWTQEDDVAFKKLRTDIN